MKITEFEETIKKFSAIPHITRHIHNIVKRLLSSQTVILAADMDGIQISVNCVDVIIKTAVHILAPVRRATDEFPLCLSDKRTNVAILLD